MKRHFSSFVFLAALIFAVAGLAIFLNVANPEKAGPFGVLLVFALIYAATFCALILLIRLMQIIFRALKPPEKTPVAQEKLRARGKRWTLIAAALAFLPIFLISLNSIGQLNFTDILLIFAVEAVAIFYIVRKI